MLLIIGFPVTDEPSRRADRLRPETLTPMHPCKHRSGHALGLRRFTTARLEIGRPFQLGQHWSRHRAKRDGATPPFGGSESAPI